MKESKVNDMKTTALWSTTHKVLLAADVFEGKACEETATPVAASRSALNSAHALLTRPDSRFFQRKGRRDVIARCLRFAATMRAVALGAVFASIGFACDHEAPVASAEGAIDEQPARGVRTDVGRTVSQTERARLVSPEPIPAPQQLPLPVGPTDVLRDAYRSEVLRAVGSARILVRVEAATQHADGTLLQTTTLAGPGPRERRIFLITGGEERAGRTEAGATLLVHVPADPPPVGPTLPLRGLLGGALPAAVPTGPLSDGRFEARFPWGTEMVTADDIGGTL